MKKIYLIIMILFTLFIVGCNTQPPITVIHPEIYEVEMDMIRLYEPVLLKFQQVLLMKLKCIII